MAQGKHPFQRVLILVLDIDHGFGRIRPQWFNGRRQNVHNFSWQGLHHGVGCVTCNTGKVYSGNW